MGTAVVGAPEAMGHGLVFVYQFDGDNWQLSETLVPDDGKQGDDFGYAVSINQGRIVVGARKAHFGFDQKGAAYVFEYNGTDLEWQQTQKLIAVDGEDKDQFGAAVAQYGETIVVGAPQNDRNGLYGQVYIYTLSNDEWLEQHIRGGNFFGEQLAIHESQLFVSATNESVNGNAKSGSVYVYDFVGNNWAYNQKLSASDAAENNYFGSSLDVDAGILVIGASKDGKYVDAGGPSAVYLYELDQANWVEQQKLTAPNENHFNRFGAHVQIDGDNIFVSAVADESLDLFEGRVYIFEQGGTNWSVSTELGPLTGSDDHDLNFSLAVDGSELIIGASGDDTLDDEAGSMMSYSYSNFQWSANDKVNMLPGSARNYFGRSTAIDGNHMLIGSYGDDTINRESGSVYAYVLSEEEWLPGPKIYANNPSAHENFGYSVAMDGLTAIIGAPGFDKNTHNPGSAYLYTFNGTEWVFEAKLTPSDGVDDDYFGGAVSIYGDCVLVAATGSDTYGDRSGAAYLFKKDNGQWTELKKFSIPNPAADDWLGTDVAINNQWAVVGQSEAVHFFNASTNWMHDQTITGSGRFGSALDLDGDTVLIGSYLASAGLNSGSAWIYIYDGSQWQFNQRIYPQTGGFNFFGIDVAISQNNLIIASTWARESGIPYSGAAYWYVKENNVWQERQFFIHNQPKLGDLLGESVSIDGEQTVVGAVGIDDFGTNSGAAFVFKATDIIFENGFDW